MLELTATNISLVLIVWIVTFSVALSIVVYRWLLTKPKFCKWFGIADVTYFCKLFNRPIDKNFCMKICKKTDFSVPCKYFEESHICFKTKRKKND